MIIFDKITFRRIASASITFDHAVSNQGAVVVICCATQGTLTLTYNGVTLTPAISNSGTTPSGFIFYITNPPIGISSIVANGTTNISIDAYTILGVDNKSSNIITSSSFNAAAVSSINTTINSPIANSLIINLITSSSNTWFPDPSQKAIIQNNNNGAHTTSFLIATGTQSLSWTTSATSRFVQCTLILAPANNPSIWNPNINTRNIYDLNRTRGLDPLQLNNVSNSEDIGNRSNPFFQNSFLHTIGRMLRPPPGIATKTAETEQKTSQIIIDKVYQGQKSGGATLNMQVNIPSQDADLIVTGGSVIATGGAWQSVTLNGNPMTRLVQTGVAGQSSEIWWSPRPGVGTKTLSIVPTAVTGEVYANAMVVLGLDNRNQNIITTSITDAAATSTIVGQITPDAPNSLIIANLTALDATANPVPDASQTQVFNATAINASECVLTTYEIQSNTQQTQSFNLSAAVNASLVVAVFRPNQSPSMWFPNIGLRQLSDVVDTAGLDAEINPAFGSYGYKASTFWENSFLHTVGRLYTVPPQDLIGLKSGLISYYKLDETTGAFAKDEMNNYPGTWRLPDNSNHQRGIINSGAYFNNRNNWIDINTRFILGGMRNSSISLWFNTIDIPQVQDSPLYAERAAAGNDIFKIGFITASGVLRFTFRDNGNTLTQFNAGTKIFNDGLNHHAVFTKRGSNIIWYVDGVQVANTNTTTTDSFTDANPHVLIGADFQDLNGKFHGMVDEVGLWSRDLSRSEVTALYNNGQGLSFPFLPNSNQFAIGVQGYNYYNSPTGRAWQTSFLQTIGRRIYDPNTPALIVNTFNSWKMMMGIGI